MKDSYFRFSGKLYKQVDGLAMGSPIAPVIANIFLCNLENNYLDLSPPNTKPFFYRRYLDDTFLLLISSDEAREFHEDMDALHPNIKFTIENEADNKSSFLDVTVAKGDNSFNASV